jgi:4-alpha-glucanotransferase
VRAAAARLGVALMGDLPFAPSENSADVWAHPEVFDLSRSIGAPPDEFSATGQRWGLPMIRWRELRRSDWRWLRERARRMAELYDLFRVDHVVGLFRTFYFVGDSPGDFDPADPAAQAEQGREILRLLLEEGGAAKPVAEDLGTVPRFVRETLAALDIPGYQVLRWQRDEHGFVDPASYPECSVATTGSHDTSTLAEWWEELTESERLELMRLAGGSGEATKSALPRRAVLDRLYRSKSRYVIPPIQDLFGWRERINLPGVIGEDNWTFRLPLSVDKLRSDPVIRREGRALRRSIDASGRLRTMDASIAPRRDEG